MTNSHQFVLYSHFINIIFRYWHCKCVLSDVTVHGFGNSKKNAKYEAVDIALIALKSTLAKKLNVYFISMKVKYDDVY